VFLFHCQRYVTHPYQTTDTVIVLCILIFKFLDNKLEGIRYCIDQ